ncbi:hypothetical protein CTAYLR_005962 [Chrysophaeum taylorii]|uniref:Fatty acid hydroxylase domain-containing protein n=1 Tax=Chrysophaeum taylorii TaxID=2483200 RepID=A0AAD7UIS4_9STRA|nr:hypothetical protein CTAYLR_005962 [Chrysophaeum taylorii]
MDQFTPRLGVRPEYPPLRKIVVKSLRPYVRDCVFAVLILAVVKPIDPGRLGERLCFAIGTALVHSTALVLLALPLSVCDRFGLLSQYKLPRKPSQLAPPSLVASLVGEVAVSHLVTTPLAAYLFFPILKAFGMPAFTDVPVNVIKHIVFAHLCNDLGFYWSHRCLHTRLLYKHVHKKHHAFAATVAPAAEFASIFEVVFSNILPTVVGCVLVGSHVLVFWTWLFLRLQQTYEVHSGYAFSNTWVETPSAATLLLAQPESVIEHDHHHTVNRGTFGALWLDYLCGTMDAFVAAGAYDCLGPPAAVS